MKRNPLAESLGVRGFKGFARRVVYETRVHAERIRAPRRRPCVVMFPSSQPWDPASNLRAWLVQPALQALGWRVVMVPEPLSLSQRRRILALERPDVVFMQQTRHRLNQPKFYPGVPCVVDADDADYLDPRNQEHIAETAADAALIVGGSRFVASCLGKHNAEAHVLWTSTPRAATPPRRRPDTEPIVTWAHAAPLHYPHEAAFVQQVMLRVCQKRRTRFRLFGVTERAAEAWLAPLREVGVQAEAVPPLPYEAYLKRVAECAIGLQPIAPEHEFAQGKSFGKLLAYLSGQVAVVASCAVDHPRFFRHGVNAMLPAHSVEAWSEDILFLLDNPTQRQNMVQTAWDDFQRRLTTDRFAELLDALLRRAGNLPLSNQHEQCLDRTRLRR